jgi:molybdopterin molybdotransferase
MAGAVTKLLAPEQALELVLERTQPLTAVEVELVDALERVLAEDVTSADDVPSFDNSAMDGFAIRSGDTAGASERRPVALEVADESRAGRPSRVTLRSGQAIRISTGAMLPAGADAVARSEDCRERDGSVEVLVPVAPGKEVRRAGEDMRAGEVVLERGTLLGPAELGVLASAGAARVRCARRPRVAVLITGDELVEPGHPLAPGQVRNSNAYSVTAQVRRAGAELASLRHVGDDREATVEAVRAALDSDLLIACGGVSVGPHDHVKAAFAALAVEEVFWGVALRPGHPTWFGVKKNSGFRLGAKTGSSEAPLAGTSEGTTLVFGLPGNPVSAMVTFHLFARPAIAALSGATLPRRRASAVIDERYGKRPGRAHVVRCRLEARGDGWHVRPTKAQGSHVLTSMLGAEALAYVEVERGDVEAGERVEIEILSN